MNILIVSYESWRETNNGGNVLSNVFSSFEDVNIAQVYCSAEYPDNTICQKYFQISDMMLLTREKGCALEERNYKFNDKTSSDLVENKIKNRIPDIFRESILLAREFLWMISNWKTMELKNFVLEFKPDIIFAPCYSYFHVSKLALYVKEIAKCPMISYISDDNYSIKQFRLSPSFWINRFITRKWIRKLFLECSFVYTMTKAQKDEYEKIFNVPMKILCKSATFSTVSKEVNSPIKFIYGGGLYLNRWRILEKIAKSLAVINEEKIKAQLHIYSNSKLNISKKKRISDGKSVFLHDSIPYDELREEYVKSDVAVHVESFDLKNRFITRLSFSTKIIDCMNSGCAILAIGPYSQAGIAYLKDNEAAICVCKLKLLHDTINNIVSHPKVIKEYSSKAKKLGLKNHLKSEIEKKIKQDFYEVVKGDGETILRDRTNYDYMY